MRLFLIRHGETVDNVAGVYAGITDSALTTHGVLQANRLGAHLAAIGIKILHIFSSNLQRAFLTAEAIREAQDPSASKTTQLEMLREQDFGIYEGKQFFERPKEGNKSGKDAQLEAHRVDPGFQDVESKENMKMRMERFVDDHLSRLMHEVAAHQSVVVVAHGIILNHLWKVLLKRFPPGNVRVLPGVQAADRGFSLEYLGGWSNTGYLELEVKLKQGDLQQSPTKASPTPTHETELDKSESTYPVQGSSSSTQTEPSNSSGKSSSVPQQTSTPPPVLAKAPPKTTKLLNMSLLVMSVNNQTHLKGLKKTRGGIGSLKHDSSQKTMDSFFKKRRLE